MKNAANARNYKLPKATGDRLFTIFPRDGYRLYDVMWVSLDARDMAMKALKKKVE